MAENEERLLRCLDKMQVCRPHLLLLSTIAYARGVCLSLLVVSRALSRIV
jgi:hypothetical protein